MYLPLDVYLLTVRTPTTMPCFELGLLIDISPIKPLSIDEAAWTPLDMALGSCRPMIATILAAIVAIPPPICASLANDK